MADELHGSQGADIGKERRQQGDAGELPAGEKEEEQDRNTYGNDPKHGGKAAEEYISDVPSPLNFTMITS